MNLSESQYTPPPVDTLYAFHGDASVGVPPQITTLQQAEEFAVLLEVMRDAARRRVVVLEDYAAKLSTALKVAAAEAAGLREQLRRQRAVADLVLHPKEAAPEIPMEVGPIVPSFIKYPPTGAGVENEKGQA